jgi:preprotein translocase subunit YajC
VDIFPLLLLAAMAVLLFVLPARQRKKMQAQAQALQESLTVGTPVMTTSGMHGIVAGLAERTVDLEIAPGVVVTFARPAIMEIRTPAVATPIEDTGNGASGSTGGRPADGTV